MTRRRGKRKFVFTLPIRRVNRLLRCVVFVFGVLLLFCALLTSQGPIWLLTFGAILGWFGLVLIFQSRHRSWQRVSRRRSSCVISCLSICLDFVGYPWDVEHLESELRLSQNSQGTLIRTLLGFPGNHGIISKMFAVQTVSDLGANLREHSSPMIALIPRPILLEPNVWALSVFPLQAIRSWLKRDSANAVNHAIVVYGVIDDRVAVFDPALSTTHTVKFSWLAKRLIPFVNKPYCRDLKLLAFGP